MPLHDIPSPLPGTFYRRPSPDAAPFVERGATVAAGAVIGIVEVMKQFNQIETPTGGVVAEILVEDGEPVEAGQPLLRIEG
ncbi:MULTISPECIES: acetyl-CoA carboxylase [Achromobacter]|jgi:acetyl-CoA carboxylase biotin carboxyl carrier protein|uniref:Biotin carboxyl carrier protein of acetyl-CoA carboxylase n=2 Tax=Achromobacter aegrifaciens TaxID=1287736 RepID=A0ABU2DM23_ACHAE|nr:MULTISPECIES: acetyl-CoA carboxylase [Achromobacter]PTN51338.1 biotin carboxyl carrier domain-containing protein [Achromobacter xylosoxidans]MBD9384505.1 biotin carboxyl carrier domain-containing protein [Achromobacter sp. ACM02]MBD9419790.1 biotin carboxyl carrier domain-containing protein [Achromobacter sp. ACM04]MBD9431294.1 biotin carboxyl carrier domain-containing protein [Achromobacter sp. ACM03]MDQ1764035.1 acetyl-CoA carboxylase [Achromobacter aegrifaciens]